MDNGSPSLPDQRDFQYAYGQAYDLARKELATLVDIEGQCRRSGADCLPEDPERTIALTYLNEPYRIRLSDAAIHRQGNRQPVPVLDKLLILHYFLRARGSPLSQKQITYKELVGGGSYYPTFYKRAVKPVVGCFGDRPEAIIKAAERLGGRQVDYGDTAVTIDAFSRVPLTWVLWKGDAELPAEGSILFDSAISDYLPTEDIAVLCQTIAGKLARLAKEEGPQGD
jgi:hypothetical protein